MPDEKTVTLHVEQFLEDGKKDIEDIVARETPLTIILNNQELVTMLCSPEDLKALAVGFLYSEGLLADREEIKKVLVDARRGVARVETRHPDTDLAEEPFKRIITSGCGRGASFYSAADLKKQTRVTSPTTITTAQVFHLMREFLQRSQVHHETGGVHSAALSDTDGILIFKDDIGRHNAIDKVLGESLLDGIPTADRIIITTGRMTSEIVLKAAKRDMPIIISKSAPTSAGVNLAEELGITLIGFVRGKRMNVYAHSGRIKPPVGA
ncbi:MAG: formate dehydrogenase accessory sulfurtransferase FdhD [Chloroflexota bacterium]